MMERIIACIPPNSKRVEYIDPIHEPLDGPLYMRSHIHQQEVMAEAACKMAICRERMVKERLRKGAVDQVNLTVVVATMVATMMGEAGDESGRPPR
jgi:hypothetical protein